MTVLIDDEYKTVELFIENLLWGKIKANFFRIVELTKDTSYTDNISQKVYRWKYLHTKKDCSEEECQEYWYISHDLCGLYMEGRIDGTIEGELQDIDFDKKLKKLQDEKEKWKSEFERVNAENKQLAEELHDQYNIIKSYENRAYKE